MDSPVTRVLFVIDEIALVDHLVAAARQFSGCGGVVCIVNLSEQSLPEWAKRSLAFATFLSANESLAKGASWDGLWFARPYPEVLPTEWQKLQKKVPVIYSGYGLPISRWDEHAHETFLREICDVILVRSAAELQRIRTLGLAHKAISAGDPLLHEVISSARCVRGSGGYRSLLWAPHWSKRVSGARGFYNWRWTVGPLYRHMRNNPEINLVVRAHPFLTAPETRFSRSKAVRKLFSLSNVSPSAAGLVEDIKRADALITDGVSIIGYFAAIEKPMAVTHHLLLRPHFSEEGKGLVGAARKVFTPWGVHRFLALLQSDYESALKKTVIPHNLLRELLIVGETPPGESFARVGRASTQEGPLPEKGNI